MSSANNGKKYRATFSIPCLNEKDTLGKLLAECNDVFSKDTDVQWQILVADNGSTDGSQEIAKNSGAEVVDVFDGRIPTTLSTAGNIRSDIEEVNETAVTGDGASPTWGP